MAIVIGPVLIRANGYSFDTWTAGKGVTRSYPYRRIEDAHYARNAEIKGVCTASHPVRDCLPDPRRVHREIHRVRNACRRLTGLARQSRNLAVDAGATTVVKSPPCRNGVMIDDKNFAPMAADSTVLRWPRARPAERLLVSQPA